MKRDNPFPINLFCSLMLLSFIPFLYTLVRTNLIVNSPSTDVFGLFQYLCKYNMCCSMPDCRVQGKVNCHHI